MKSNAASRRRPPAAVRPAEAPRPVLVRPGQVGPEELGTMLSVGGRSGEDRRLDEGLVRAAVDPSYRARVVVQVRGLRAASYAPRRDGFVWSVGLVAGLWFVRMLLSL